MRRPWRRTGMALVLGISACVQPDTAPEEPAAIEFAPFPWPAVVVGDVLRDEAGDSIPLRAIVRNVGGTELSDVTVRFLIPDSASRRRVRVDSVRGFVRGDSVTAQPVRVIARASDALQAVSPSQGRPDGGLVVVPRPDSLARSGTRTADTLTIASGADTVVTVGSITGNLSSNLSTVLWNVAGTQRTGVQRWLVRYRLVEPLNPTNDSTQAIFLVNRDGSPRRATLVDTTDTQGEAGLAIRARGRQVPASLQRVVVEARASYRGRPIGSPVRFDVVVRRP